MPCLLRNAASGPREQEERVMVLPPERCKYRDTTLTSAAGASPTTFDIISAAGSNHRACVKEYTLKAGILIHRVMGWL